MIRKGPQIRRHPGCPTGNHSIRHRTKNAPLDLLGQIGTVRRFSAGEVIYNQGDGCAGIYCVKTGLVGVRRLDEQGHSALLRLVHPGAIFGYRSFIRMVPHENAAEALASSEIHYLNRASARCLLQKEPQVALILLEWSLRDLSEVEDRYMESVTTRVKARLLNLVLMLYEHFGWETEDGEHLIELPVSRQDLAGLIGVAPETMSRVIHKLRSEGLAEFNGRFVWIPDLDMIARDVSP